MEKIIITATAESIEQVKQLLEAGVDRIYVGEKAVSYTHLSKNWHQSSMDVVVVNQTWPWQEEATKLKSKNCWMK